jgi:hypothetical protein
MSRWCVHYACTKEILDHVLFVLDQDADEDYDALYEDVLRDIPNSLPRYGVDKLWEDVHRCLTGDASDFLDFDEGIYPLKLCIHGGRWLREPPESVALVHAEQVPDLHRALEAIDRESVRQRLLALEEAGVEWYRERGSEDQEVETVWGEIQEYVRFYGAAEKAGLSVICTISH